jgi:hypothetical protein
MIRAGAEASLEFPPYTKGVIACLANVNGYPSDYSRQVQRRLDINFRAIATADETLNEIAALSWSVL